MLLLLIILDTEFGNKDERREVYRAIFAEE